MVWVQTFWAQDIQTENSKSYRLLAYWHLAGELKRSTRGHIWDGFELWNWKKDEGLARVVIRESSRSVGSDWKECLGWSHDLFLEIGAST